MIRRRQDSEIIASSALAPPLTSPLPSLFEGTVTSSSSSTVTKTEKIKVTPSSIGQLTPPMKAKMSGFKINDINFTQCQSADDPITIIINGHSLFICIEKLSLEFSIPFDHIKDMTITGQSKYGESLVIDLKQAPDIALMSNCEFSPSGLNSQLSIFKELLDVSTWPGTMQIYNVSASLLFYFICYHELHFSFNFFCVFIYRSAIKEQIITRSFISFKQSYALFLLSLI